MVPRVHVTFADVASTYDELIDIFREDKFTRLPVYKDSQNNIVGIINMKDLLLYDKNEEFVIDRFLRKPHFTYETKSISDLLVEMKDSTFNIAIVLDEYGDMPDLLHWRISWRKSSARSMTSTTRKRTNLSRKFPTVNISSRVPCTWTM